MPITAAATAEKCISRKKGKGLGSRDHRQQQQQKKEELLTQQPDPNVEMLEYRIKSEQLASYVLQVSTVFNKCEMGCVA